jgi:CRP-like cAMP-binding protein
MENYLEILRQCPLFAGVADGALGELLRCLAPRTATYERGEFIFRAGEGFRAVGVVLTGGALILREDYWGNRAILTRAGQGELFAEAFACAGTAPTVSAQASAHCEVMLFDCERLLTACPASCAHHAAIIRNLARALAEKNVALTQKMEHVTCRSTREKLLSYLSAHARAAGSGAFAIPFSRQELADYLSVDRSAMSAELGRMRDDGILRFARNRFELL